MKFTVESIDKSTKKIRIQVPAAMVTEIMEAVFKAQKERAIINGKSRGQATAEEVRVVFKDILNQDSANLIRQIALKIVLKRMSADAVGSTYEKRLEKVDPPIAGSDYHYIAEFSFWAEAENKTVKEAVTLALKTYFQHSPPGRHIAKFIDSFIADYDFCLPSCLIDSGMVFATSEHRYTAQRNIQEGYRSGSAEPTDTELSLMRARCIRKLKIQLYAYLLARELNVFVEPIPNENEQERIFQLYFNPRI